MHTARFSWCILGSQLPPQYMLGSQPPPLLSACWEANPPFQCMLGSQPPVNRMTHRCKNITLPQTSLSGGNKNLGGASFYNEFVNGRQRVLYPKI